jgi:hypothetical protein
MEGNDMFSFEVVENVEMNEDNGGWIIVKVVEDKVVEFVELSFDFGESLGSVVIVEKDGNGKWMEKFSNVEDVFSSEVSKKIVEMDFEISIGDVKE